MEGNEIPGENHRLTPSHWQPVHMPQVLSGMHNLRMIDMLDGKVDVEALLEYFDIYD